MTRKKPVQEGVVLSAQQAEILAGIGAGETYSTVAKRLSLSTSTIGYHVGRLQQKLHAGNVPALIALVMVAGILTTDQFPIQATGDLVIDPSLIPD
ncbi:helix-turn-helix transcriptional regulator [Frondihabitans peucedani]|uniref:HTH luxR-type domain-containing protein n=1 Tax=Frondihabitans peucedani TaxID=598626 RepID=A0ABP8E5M2_9MICO